MDDQTIPSTREARGDRGHRSWWRLISSTGVAAAVALTGATVYQHAFANGSTTLVAAQQTPTSIAITTSTSAQAQGKAATTTLVPSTTVTTSPATTTTRPKSLRCDAARPLLDLLHRISISLTDPNALRTLLESATPKSGAFADSAPNDAKADADSLKALLADMTSALERADYELAKLPPEYVIKLHSPEATSLILRFESLVAKSC